MPGACDLLVEIGHLRAGDVQQPAAAFAALLQFVAFQNDNFGLAGRIQPVFLAATPGLQGLGGDTVAGGLGTA